MTTESTWRQIQRKIETCLTEGRYLTTWETDFLERMNDKVTMGEELTPRERNKLDEIYATRVP